MSLKDQILSFVVTYGFHILGGIIIFACGFFVSQVVAKFLRKFLKRFDLEPPVENLLVMLSRVLILAVTAVLTVAKMGVDIAPLVAGMGVIGVGIGLATQGVLSNMVAGLTIIFVKPFRVGEFIELIGVEGVVQMIGLFSTRLEHFDKSIVVIPNRKIVGEVLHNYGMIRQLELSIGIAYDSELEKAENAIREALARNPRVLQDPPPVLGVSQLKDSSIAWTIRPWVKVPDYIAAPGELYRAVMANFHAAGIEMPYPQREIRILPDPQAFGKGAGRPAAGI